MTSLHPLHTIHSMPSLCHQDTPFILLFLAVQRSLKLRRALAHMVVHQISQHQPQLRLLKVNCSEARTAGCTDGCRYTPRPRWPVGAVCVPSINEVSRPLLKVSEDFLTNMGYQPKAPKRPRQPFSTLGFLLPSLRQSAAVGNSAVRGRCVGFGTGKTHGQQAEHQTNWEEGDSSVVDEPGRRRPWPCRLLPMTLG